MILTKIEMGVTFLDMLSEITELPEQFITLVNVTLEKHFLMDVFHVFNNCLFHVFFAATWANHPHFLSRRHPKESLLKSLEMFYTAVLKCTF